MSCYKYHKFDQLQCKRFNSINYLKPHIINTPTTITFSLSEKKIFCL